MSTTSEGATPTPSPLVQRASNTTEELSFNFKETRGRKLFGGSDTRYANLNEKRKDLGKSMLE